MGTISGSVVEPATPYYPPEYQKQQKQNKILLLATIIEAVVIVGLIFGLIFVIMMASESNYQIDSDVSAGGEMDGVEFYDFPIEEKETSALMYTYAIANDNTLGNSIPTEICTMISKLYNQFTIDDSSLDNPCPNGRIALTANQAESEIYPYLTLNLLTVVVDNKAYGLYIYPDFLTFNYSKMLDVVPSDLTVINVIGG